MFFLKYEKIDNRSWDIYALSYTKICFSTFFNNQKLLILFNKSDAIGGQSLVKPCLNIYIP